MDIRPAAEEGFRISTDGGNGDRIERGNNGDGQALRQLFVDAPQQHAVEIEDAKLQQQRVSIRRVGAHGCNRHARRGDLAGDRGLRVRGRIRVRRNGPILNGLTERLAMVGSAVSVEVALTFTVPAPLIVMSAQHR